MDLKPLMILLIISVVMLTAEIRLSSAEDAPVWVEAVGEAVGGELDPPREVMDRAANEAKRKAIDQAVGSFLKSHTLVTNAQLAEEMTFARVKGKIEKVEFLSAERDRTDPNLYRVRLKVLVKPVMPQDAEGLQVKLDLSRTMLREGEEVKVLYQVNADCYVYLFSIAADNSVTLLLPNSLHHDNSIRANSGAVFPPEGSPIHLRALRLPGYGDRSVQEKIKLVATRKKETLLEGFQEGMFKVYDATSAALVGDLVRRLNQLDPADWGDAVAVYTISPHEKHHHHNKEE